MKVQGGISALVRIFGIVGSGQMGSGIAQVAAASGCDVVLYDPNKTALERSMRAIEKSLSVSVQKHLVNEENAKMVLDRLTLASELKVKHTHRDKTSCSEGISVRTPFSHAKFLAHVPTGYGNCRFRRRGDTGKRGHQSSRVSVS